MLEKILQPTLYHPTQPRTGDREPTLLRLGNLVLTGQNGMVYLEVYKGQSDLGETIPTEDITGTIAISADSTSVVGTGTTFTTELRSGQRFFVDDFLLIVNQVTDDTHLTVYKAPTDPVAAAIAERAPVMYEIQGQRGTQILGNSVESDKGTILGAGFGTVRINGDVLSGVSMVLDGAPMIAIFDPATGLYAVYDLSPGMQPPTTSPAAASVVGGTHNMQPGNFSARLVPGRTATQGYTNPGPQIPFTIANAGERCELDFSGGPAMDTAVGQTEWDIYSCENLDSVPVNVQGPWNFVLTITQDELTLASDKAYLDFANAEINRLGLLDFNNDPPPPSGYVAFLEGGPVWISCRGKLSDTFGPSIRPSKPRNIEAAPADWDVTSTPPQNILGVTTSLARLYFPTPTSLQQGLYIGTDVLQIQPPVSMRPYWRVGFIHEGQLVFVGQDLYGYPHQGPTRSVADADTVSEQYFGQQIAEITKNWNSAYVFVGHDPKLDAICLFHSMDSQNDGGFWRTRVLLWGVQQNGYIGDSFIESDTRDMNVCSVATVNERLYFLAGGRLGADIQVDTFAFNESDGDPVEYYAAWSGVSHPDQNLSVRAARATGKFTDGSLQIHGWDEGVDIDYDALEAGTGALIEFPMSTTTGVVRKFRKRFNAPNCGLAILRVSGTWSGDDDPDQVHGAFMAGLPNGNRR